MNIKEELESKSFYAIEANGDYCSKCGKPCDTKNYDANVFDLVSKCCGEPTKDNPRVIDIEDALASIDKIEEIIDEMIKSLSGYTGVMGYNNVLKIGILTELKSKITSNEKM